MPRRKVEQPALELESAALVCEVCGETVAKLSNRHPPSGLAACFECVTLPSSEIAVRWMRKIRRVIER